MTGERVTERVTYSYTQITRSRPWTHFQVVRFDNWAFGARVWRRGFSVRLFARTVMFESRDPWDHTEDIAAQSWGIGCKRSWRSSGLSPAPKRR